MTDRTDIEDEDLVAAQRMREAYDRLQEQIARVIVGQKEVIEQLLIALFCRGHCILEGVPGLAKTLLISTLARCLNLSFSRIQFTPDLMPADITGTEVMVENRSTGARELRFLEGPIFANVILADEINRTPPKTQAALLEAMQERQVTIGRARHPLSDPFFVLATQNPIEQEGTYALPEAQQDRFMFKVLIDYPSYAEEYEIATSTTGVAQADVSPVLSGEEILALMHVVRRVPAAPAVVRFALDLTRRSRPSEPDAPEVVRRMVSWGAGPRAVQFLILGAKARAALRGHPAAATEDVQAVARPVLRHRIITNFAAQAERFSVDRLIDELVASTPTHRDERVEDSRLAKAIQA